MTNLKLVFPTQKYENEWHSIINEIEKANGEIIPFALKGNASDYTEYLESTKRFSQGIDLPNNLVRADTFFLVNGENNRILGAINIRYELNEYLLNYGGNIGYGIRPTERKKGYAKEMLRLALDICKEKGMDKVLITCDKSNKGSARTIIKNGGILENEVLEDGELVQRYWVSI